MAFFLNFVFFAAVLVILSKIYVKIITGKYNGKERLDGETVIITGANSGIGSICAKDFARRGARIVMVCRDMRKANLVKDEIIRDTGNKNIKVKHIDFTSLTSVRKCAKEILAEESQINILLNNAGAALIGLDETEDNIDTLMQINYFAPFLFTNLLLGKIKKSAPSRIVNVTSVLHKFGSIDFTNIKKPKRLFTMQLYADSKVALVCFSNELARKIKGSGVTVNCLHPGTFPSDIPRHGNILIRFFWNHILSFICRKMEDGAETSIYCCVSPDLRNTTGCYFEECKIHKAAKITQDSKICRKLWTVTKDIVQLKNSEKFYKN